MIAVLGLMVAIFLAGRYLDLSKRSQIMALIFLFGLVLTLQLLLPEDNPLRQATGGSLSNWLILGGAAAIFLGYRSLLDRLRRGPVEDQPPPKSPDQFSDSELDRYARHIVLREVGGPGQKRMKKAKVLVIGAGGLGAPALQYLAAAGFGTIGVIDDDEVDNSNLQRQVIHTDDRIGMPKVFSAEQAMKAQNPFVNVKPYHRRLTAEIAPELFSEYDIVLDGTDDVETRYLVNRAAVAANIPLISGAISQWEGQISVFDPGHEGPCYACVFPDPAAAGLAPSCAEAGVVGALPGVVGSMMALEAIKITTDAGTALRGQMLIYDGLYGETRTIQIKRRADCQVCGTAQ